MVLLATPPGFRPHASGGVHRRRQACLLRKAGRHRRARRALACWQTSELAKQKNLSLVAGFCWRYNNMIQDTFQQVENGAIGKLVAYYATYYTNPVKPMPPASARPAGMSDVEWQIRNWYNFVWLCGDSLVEQAVHSADKIAWAMHDEPPVSCVGVGGRDDSRRGRQHLRPLRSQLPLSERRARLPGQPPDRGLPQRECRLHAGHRRHLHHRHADPLPRIEGKNQLDLHRPAVQHVPARARPAVRLDPQERADERRQAHGDQHAAGA